MSILLTLCNSVFVEVGHYMKLEGSLAFKQWMLNAMVREYGPESAPLRMVRRYQARSILQFMTIL